MTDATSMTIDAAIADVESDLALFSDWEERFGYLIDLGKSLPPLAEDERVEATKVRGCASQVWMVSALKDGRLTFRGQSDAFLVNGLIALLLRIFSGRTPKEILTVDMLALASRLGLKDALTSQRSNGLAAMMARVRDVAQASL